MNEAEVLDAVESTFVIVFLISILSVKKFIKSLLLNFEGIFRSGDIGLFVNLATVLHKKPWIVLVIIYEFVDMLGPGSF